MAAPSNLKVLFFDVFGTTMNQLDSVAKEFNEAAKEALNAKDTSLNSDVEAKAKSMSYSDWFNFANEWNLTEGKFKRASERTFTNAGWKSVDQNRRHTLPKFLADHGLIIRSKDSDTSPFAVEPGSLFTSTQIDHLSTVWHRLQPWPDTIAGLEKLNTKYSTAALSNTYNELMVNMVSLREIPFTRVFTSDMFTSVKPRPEVYLGAAKEMGVKPEECGLVAAHLSDLKGAKAVGFWTVYVERPAEEKNPELRGEDIPDLSIGQAENGFLSLAKRLGIQ